MADSGRQGAARAALETEGAGHKETLRRQMDETRDSIAQTVTDIKETVADQFQTVRETVADTLDWREQFRSHPVAWCLGALSVGYVLSNSAVAAFRGTKSEDHVLSHLAALGNRFADELSKHGMSILAPALTGTVLVPVLASKLSEITGLDLSDLTNQLLAETGANGVGSTKRGRKKKDGGKKRGKRKKKAKSNAV